MLLLNEGYVREVCKRALIVTGEGRAVAMLLYLVRLIKDRVDKGWKRETE